MISSMTGYGEGGAQDDGWTVQAAVKTLNHRYLDICVRGLQAYEALELRTRDLLKEAFHRGRVEATVRVAREDEAAVSFDIATARHHWNALKRLVGELGLGEPITVDHLIGIEGALVPVPPEPGGLWPVLEQALRQGVEAAQAARRREGEALTQELTRLVDAVRRELDPVVAATPALKERYRERLRERIEEVVDVELDAERLEQEVALWAERADITEEIDRMRIHLDAVRAILEKGGPAGRTLDFLGQEMYREVGTMAAKAKDGGITRRIVGIKSHIEGFREQVRNIE